MLDLGTRMLAVLDARGPNTTEVVAVESPFAVPQLVLVGVLVRTMLPADQEITALEVSTDVEAAGFA